MKANELRIGNYVLLEGIECVVSGLDVTDVTVNNHIAYENDVFCLLGKGLNGIPLTEEWLLKFGFENNGNDLCYKELHDGCELWFINGFIFVAPYDCPNESYAIETKVNHAHQLQNLYFGLTGKELNEKE